MRIFLDTDVLLDVLQRREPHFGPSNALIEWAQQHPGSAAISWHGIANIDYLLKGDTRTMVRELLGFCTVPATGHTDVERALDLKLADFEDAMQVAAAIRFDAQFIVTRNIIDYRKSPISARTPAQISSSLY